MTKSLKNSNVTNANDLPDGFDVRIDIKNAPVEFWAVYYSASFGTYKVQWCFTFENKVFYRSCNNNTWYDWRTI